MAKLSRSRLVFTSAFGDRDPIQTGAGTTPSRHIGVDFGPEVRNTPGIELCSIVDGTVSWRSDKAGALGIRTSTTATGDLLTLLRSLYVAVADGATVDVDLWHLARRIAVSGLKVVAGAVLGVMGSTGMSTGIHVHVELRIAGRVVDPKPFIDAQAFKAVAPAPADYYDDMLGENTMRNVYDVGLEASPFWETDGAGVFRELTTKADQDDAVRLHGAAVGVASATIERYRSGSIREEGVLLAALFPSGWVWAIAGQRSAAWIDIDAGDEALKSLAQKRFGAPREVPAKDWPVYKRSYGA